MLEEIVSEYRKLLGLIEEEKQEFEASVQGELNDKYKGILSQEYEKIKNQIKILNQIN